MRIIWIMSNAYAICASYNFGHARVKPWLAYLFAYLALGPFDVASAAGSVSNAVTQANIQQTICVPGYTRTVRPSFAYTNNLKKILLRRAGESLERIRDYELDHIIPLALGGHPTDHRNFMLQPWQGENGAHRKDRIEVKLQCLVCTEQILLEQAQTEIGRDWQAAYRLYAATKCHRRRSPRP